MQNDHAGGQSCWREHPQCPPVGLDLLVARVEAAQADWWEGWLVAQERCQVVLQPLLILLVQLARRTGLDP